MSRAPEPTAAEALARRLAPRLGDRLERDVPAGSLTTYRVGGPIAVVVRVRDLDDLRALAEARRGLDLPVLVLGRGSNLLVADRGFAGVGVRLEGEFETLRVTDDRRAVDAGGAVALPTLARRLAADGLTGLEFFVGIPGSVGAAVRMNAGGHGRQTGDVLQWVQMVDLDSAEQACLGLDGLGLSYRHSTIGPAQVVVAARFTVAPDEREACEARIGEIVRWRREHQPGGANAGSVFVNPLDDSAGRIIDAAGLKGLRRGGASVSAKHANFIQAEPDASAADVLAVMAAVRRAVLDSSGAELTPETCLVGFDAEELASVGVGR